MDIGALKKENIENTCITIRSKYEELWNTHLKIGWENRAQKQWNLLQTAIEEGNKQCIPKKECRE